GWRELVVAQRFAPLATPRNRSRVQSMRRTARRRAGDARQKAANDLLPFARHRRPRNQYWPRPATSECALTAATKAPLRLARPKKAAAGPHPPYERPAQPHFLKWPTRPTAPASAGALPVQRSPIEKPSLDSSRSPLPIGFRLRQDIDAP